MMDPQSNFALHRKDARPWYRGALMFFTFLGMANFFVFFIAAIYLGGDAVNGKVVDGHYYLSNHGHLTEVSRRVFEYSLWHVRSLLVTHPLAMLCAWLSNREAKDAS